MLISGVIDPLTLCENVKGNTLSHRTVVPSGDGNTLRRWISRSATHRVRVGRAGEREKRRLPTYKLFGSLRGRQEYEAVRLPDFRSGERRSSYDLLVLLVWIGRTIAFFWGKAQAPCLLEMQYVPIHLKSSNLRFDLM